VLGLGRAGLAAVAALADRFGAESVRVWDDSRSDRARCVRAELESQGIGTARDGSLSGVRAIVKSPGVDPDHPLLRRGRESAIPILDELDLGWRLTRRPILAVTGTSGKSTTATLIAAALDAAGEDSVVCGNTFDGPPLSALPEAATGWAVTEVSSYQAEACPALIPSAAVFTNLGHDHLHRHGSIAAYAAAKRRLFVRGDRAVSLAVLNADDEFGRRLAREVGGRGGRAITYGWSRGADYRIRGCDWSLRRATVDLDTPGGGIRAKTRLPGAHNAANLAAAMGLAGGLGLEMERTVNALGSTPPPPGRFEPVESGQPFDVVVDFAHTPDAVGHAVGTARRVASRREGRVIVVLGAVARGQRGIREETGRAARAGADHLVLCGSSHKGEHPLVALSGLLAGARAGVGGALEVVLDRRAAIARGLARAQPGDVVTILGRGPLDRIAVDRISAPQRFDDREVARELLAGPA
jgi:UDP-N-acetylmuramoyl-L-alanyl-D-glutamate--2,6-diaminopimelate ligase